MLTPRRISFLTIHHPLFDFFPLPISCVSAALLEHGGIDSLVGKCLLVLGVLVFGLQKCELVLQYTAL